MIEFEINGKPQQRGSKRGFVVGKRAIITDDNERSASWMQQCRESAAAAMAGRDLLTGPIELTVTFRFARPKSHYGTGKNAGALKKSAPRLHAQSPDLAKLVRCLEDALTGVVWRDDRQVCSYSDCCREWTRSGEGALVSIREIHP